MSLPKTEGNERSMKLKELEEKADIVYKKSESLAGFTRTTVSALVGHQPSGEGKEEVEQACDNVYDVVDRLLARAVENMNYALGELERL